MVRLEVRRDRLRGPSLLAFQFLMVRLEVLDRADEAADFFGFNSLWFD